MRSTTNERLQQCAQAATGELTLRYETVGKERYGFDSKGRLRRKVVNDPLNANTTVITNIEYDKFGRATEQLHCISYSRESGSVEWDVVLMFATLGFAVIGVVSTIAFFVTR